MVNMGAFWATEHTEDSENSIIFLTTDCTDYTDLAFLSDSLFDASIYRSFVHSRRVPSKPDPIFEAGENAVLLDAGFLSGLEIRDWLLRFTDQRKAT